jgi:mono/diheme cytochrome c family protein
VPPALNGRRRASAMTLAAIVIMYGIAAVGVNLLHFVADNREPVRVSLPQRKAPAGGVVQATVASPSAAASASGDAVAGKKAYVASCAGCHGPMGEGIAGVGPGLRDSAFMRDSDDNAILALIINGRQASDPANKTGKVMPPRGGNPFLADGDVVNIVAFLHEITAGSTTAGTATGAAGDDVAAAVDVSAALPRWVVPAPPRPPAGVAPAFTSAALTRNDTLRLPLKVAFNSAFALHLLIGVGLMGALLWQAYTAPIGARSLSAARFARLYWLAAAAVWLVLLPSMMWW